MRADEVSEDRMSRAARLREQSVSAFVLGAATREADRVLGRADQTLMAAEQFDGLVAALDTADRAPRLRGEADRPRRFERA